MKKVAIIGGSFNPVTLGHAQMALELIKLPNIDEVWFVPNNNSVFGKELVSFDHRMNMLSLTVSELNSSIYSLHSQRFFMNHIEKDQNLPGYTLDLVEALEEKYKKNEFYYVIGQDIANSIESYRYYRTLIKTAKFIVFPRKPYLPAGNLWYMKGEHIYLQPEKDIIEVSSTEVRQIIKKGDVDNGRARLLLQDKLPKEVINYILKNKLYK